MELTAGGSYRTWNILEKIRKGVGFTRTINQDNFRGPLFGLGIFKRCNTLLWNRTCYDFSRISKTNLETSVEYLQRHFFNHLVCFILEQTPDRQIHLLFLVLRYPAHCNGLELLPESPQNKFCYRLHPKYTAFSCFPVVCTSPVWKSLFLQNRSHLTHLWYLEGSWMNAFQNFCQQFLLRSNMAYFIEQAMAPTIILYMLRKFKYWCIQKDICDIMLPLVM